LASASNPGFNVGQRLPFIFLSNCLVVPTSSLVFDSLAEYQLLIVQHLSFCEAAEREKDLANELKQSMQETMISCQERLAYVETDLQQSKEQLSTLREMMVTWHNLVAGFFWLT